MFLDKIIKQINKLLSNNSSYQLTYDKLEFYLEKSVDHINQTLFTNFRTIKEYFEDSCLYQNMMKYINTHSTISEFVGSIDWYDKYKKPFPVKKAFYEESKTITYYDKDESTLKTLDDKGNVDYLYLSSIDTIHEYFYFIPDLNLFVMYDSSNASITINTLPSSTQIKTTIQELGIEYYNYNEIPDRYIRSCVVYYTAALYLEEEDEFENQYSEYIAKASAELEAWRKQYFSCYDAKW